MFEANANKILSMLQPDDLVLDIGGWARPFNRANFIMDQEPWETRGYYGEALPAQGGPREHFTRDSWIQRDVCAREPFPFGDGEIDFVICSHTLEDIRDPIWVCSEMIRVGKAGYIEVPSRLAETCRGVEPGQVGWAHHRWLIEVAANDIEFLMKYHKIHSRWTLSFPRRFLRDLGDEGQVSWLFWEGSFAFRERTLQGPDAVTEELESFIQRHRPYPRTLVSLDRLWRELTALARRSPARIRSLLSGNG